MTKTIGTWGVFATLTSTGWSMGLPNADSPVRMSPALISSAADHNKAVLDYFVGAGLPADQIDRVDAGPTVATTTSVKDNFVPSPPQLHHYLSSIFRKVNDVPVGESFATAWINAKGEVVEESIYWPAIPASAIASAMSFRDLLSDPTRSAAVLGSVPPSSKGGRLVIHHTPCVGGPVEATATYDVIDGNRVRHFGPDGTEAFLASERGTVNTPARTPPIGASAGN
jgi:hypothetical protein